MTPGTEFRGGHAAVLIGLAVGLASFLGLAAEVQACTVCFGGEDSDWTGAFVLGTLVMLALPPAIVVGAVFAIYRATKRQEAALAEAESAADDDSAVPTPGGS